MKIYNHHAIFGTIVFTSILCLSSCQNNAPSNKALISDEIFKSIPATNSIEPEWVNSLYGNPSIQMETPYQLIESTLPVPSSARSMIDHMAVYKFAGNPRVKVMVNTATYSSSIQTNLAGSAEGAMQQLRNTPNTTKLEYTQKNSKISGKKGIIQSGSYNAGSKKIEFYNLIALDKQNYWNVLVYFDFRDTLGLKTKDRVFNSIRIK